MCSIVPCRRLLGALFLLALPLATHAQEMSVPTGGSLGPRVPVPGRAPLPPVVSYIAVSVPEAVAITPFGPTIARGPVDSYALGSGQALPTGLVLDPLTGAISGTPVDLLPPTNFTIVASNSGGQSMTQLNVEVFGVAPAGLSFAPNLFAVEIRSGPYTAFPASTGGPVDTYSVTGPPLPLGLWLDPDTGVLGGWPRSLQPSTMHTITASNETGSVDFDFLVDVFLPPAPTALDFSPPGPYSLVPLDPITPITPSVTGRVDIYYATPPLPNRQLFAIGGQVQPRTGVLLPENATPLIYAPPEQRTVHPWQRLNVWLPNGTPPSKGWPVLISNPNGGYFGAPPYDDLDPNDPIELLFHKAVNAGFALVFAGTIDSGPIVGWFYPPGHPSGHWEDPNYLMPEKDILNAVQWVKTQTSYDLDVDRVFLHGSSAGATLAAYVGLGPDLAAPDGSLQRQKSSRVAGILCFDTLTSFPAYQNDYQTLAHHWESVSNPGSNAIEMADADPAILDANSLARVLLDPLSMGATTPVFLAYEEGSSSIDYSNDGDEFPALRDTLGPIDHDLWHGAKLWERLLYLNRPFHNARSEFFVNTGVVSELGSLNGIQTGTFLGTVLDSVELYDEAIAWMVARAREPIPDPSGLQIHPKSGIIHGMPNTSTSSAMYTITAQNPGGPTTTNVVLQISAEE